MGRHPGCRSASSAKVQKVSGSDKRRTFVDGFPSLVWIFKNFADKIQGPWFFSVKII